MGQFANTLFSMLLGWVQSAVAEVWNLVTNADVSLWLRWLLDNWLPLTLMLCVGGAVVDFIVYIIRWQPYRMWGHFLHRLTGRKDSDAALQEQAGSGRRWLHADGSVTEEDICEPVRELPEEVLDAPIRPARRVARRATPEPAYHQPYYPPQWQRTNEQGEQ